jgi:hypothetical protein
MSAVMELKSARLPQFQPVTSTSSMGLRQLIVWSDDLGHSGGPQVSDAYRAAIMEAISVTSSDLDRLSTLSATRVVSAHRGLMHTLRIYTGCALVGAVVSSVALGWLGHRDITQIVGALCAVALYAIFSSRMRSTSPI